MNFLRLIHLGVLAFCWVGCSKDSPKTVTLDSTFLVLEYVVKRGMSGSIRELFVITTYEGNLGTVTNVKKDNAAFLDSVPKEIYLISEATAKDVFAILEKHNVATWKPEGPSHEPDFLAMSLSVLSPSLIQTVVFHELPDRSGDSQKRLKALIEELRTLAKQQGRLLTVKKPE